MRASIPGAGGDTGLKGTLEFADFLTLSGNFGQAGHIGQRDFDGNGALELADFFHEPAKPPILPEKRLCL